MNPTVVNVQKTLSINVIGEQRIVEVEYVTVSLNVQGNLGAGDGTTASYVAGTNLSALRAVTIDNNGRAVYASPATLSDAVVVGITSTAANALEAVSVRTAGIVTDFNWSWTKGSVYLGSNGTLTQTAPTGGLIICQVGRAIGPTKLQIDVESTIETV